MVSQGNICGGNYCGGSTRNVFLQGLEICQRQTTRAGNLSRRGKWKLEEIDNNYRIIQVRGKICGTGADLKLESGQKRIETTTQYGWTGQTG